MIDYRGSGRSSVYSCFSIYAQKSLTQRPQVYHWFVTEVTVKYYCETWDEA